jgi:hypothetical protein
MKAKILLLLLLLCLSLPACSLLQIDPSKAVYMDLSDLNNTVDEVKSSSLPNGLIIQGLVVSVNQGHAYPLVVGLAPVAAPEGTPKEVIVCLFRSAPEKKIEMKSLVSIAGYLDGASIKDHLILTGSLLVTVD